MTVPASRLQRLARGANVSMWFRYPREESDHHFRRYMTDADLALIRDLGLTSVRLAVAPKQIISRDAPDEPDPQRLAWLDEAIARLTAHGLAVVVDLHDEARLLEGGGESVERVLRFWSALAGHLHATTDPETVLLEGVNEPVFDRSAGAWFPLQERLLATIRAATPGHTLVASGPGWSSIDGLVSGVPLPDPNVVYTFHYYQPYLFTHQGAGWAPPPTRGLSGVPYPGTPWAVARRVASTGDPDARCVLLAYALQRWNAKKIERQVLRAAEWARAHRVPLWAGEFGAHPPAAPRADRLRWLSDVRRVLERHGVGWCVWSYDEPLGLDRKLDGAGAVTIDVDSARALGLRR